MDSVVLLLAMLPGFAAKIETKKVIGLNTMIESLQSIYISRGGTDKQRSDNMKEIADHQARVENDPRFSAICIYAEGTQTNGTHVLNFKKGAFASMKTVTPVVIKYNWKHVSPTWEGFSFLASVIILYAYPEFGTVEVTILPPLLPNEHLLKTHAEKGKEDWEIFAWAVRDVIAKFGNFKLCNQSNADKILYKDFMSGKTDKLEFGGKVWTAKPMYKKKIDKKTN